MEWGMIMFHHNQRDPRRRHRRGDQGGVPCFWQGGPRIHTGARPDRGALSLFLSRLLNPQLNTGSTKARWKTLPFWVPGLKMKVVRVRDREAQKGPGGPICSLCTMFRLFSQRRYLFLFQRCDISKAKAGADEWSRHRWRREHQLWRICHNDV